MTNNATSLSAPSLSPEKDFTWRSARMVSGKNGYITSRYGPEKLECTIIELSLSGVRLQIASDKRIANSFALVIDGNRLADCEIVWRRGDQIGARIGGMRALLSR